MSLDLSQEQLNIVKQILQQYVPHLSVWAFGSRAKQKSKPYSDLDLAIITDTPLSFAEHADLVDAFCQSDLPWKVDIVDWAITSDEFRQIILEHYIVIQP